MEKVFVNFTNHPSSDWGEKQTTEAEKYGKIHDIPFPQVDPMSTEQEIQQLGEQCYKEIMKYHPIAVLCQGEFTLAVYVINRLRQKNIKVLAACTKRIAVMEGNKKQSVFVFEKFREYS